jgi:hypothetical protein
MPVGTWLVVEACVVVGGWAAGRVTGRAAPASIPRADVAPKAVRMAAAHIRESVQPGADEGIAAGVTTLIPYGSTGDIPAGGQ